jgi:hypothetical protein
LGSNIQSVTTELTTGVPFTTDSAGWDGSAWMSELADLPNVGDVITGGKIYVGTSAGNVRLGLYSDNGNGVPQTLLAETASTAVGSAGAWQEIDFITPYTTTSTGKLHLGLQTDTSQSGFGYTVTITNARSEVVTSYGAFPNTITSQTTDSYPADLRAVVERDVEAPYTINIDGMIDEYFINSDALTTSEISKIDRRGETASPVTTTSTSFNDNTVVAGNEYFYKVYSVTPDGYGTVHKQ